MELKDLVQEVLGEISRAENSIEKKQEEEEKVKEIQSIFKEDEEDNKEESIVVEEREETVPKDLPQERVHEVRDTISEIAQSIEEIENGSSDNNAEEIFLGDLKERLLVIFEGFQSPNNQNVEAKLDLTLNFLEYLLAKVDDRLEEIDSTKP